MEVGPGLLVNFGLGGVLFALVLAGWIWAKPAVDEIKAQRDGAVVRAEKAEAQRDSLIETYNGAVLPALRDANSTASKVADQYAQVVMTTTRTERVLAAVEALLQKAS